jgi:hypothetical protein
MQYKHEKCTPPPLRIFHSRLYSSLSFTIFSGFVHSECIFINTVLFFTQPKRGMRTNTSLDRLHIYRMTQGSQSAVQSNTRHSRTTMCVSTPRFLLNSEHEGHREAKGDSFEDYELIEQSLTACTERKCGYFYNNTRKTVVIQEWTTQAT